MRNCLIPLLVLLLTKYSNAQVKITNPLAIGDTIPNINVILHTAENISKTNISAFKGRLLILDFWGIHCIDCIANMPKLVELQKQYENQIKIILVTSDSPDEIHRTFQKFRNNTLTNKWVEAGMALPIIENDTILGTLFPHNTLPTHVWITQNQIFKGMVYDNMTTSANIHDFLEGKEIKWITKNLVDVNIDDPLSWIDHKIDFPSHIQSYSLFSTRFEFGRMAGISSVNFDLATKKIDGFNFLNEPIIYLYKVAYENWKPIFPFETHASGLPPNDRIIVEAREKNKFFIPLNSDVNSWLDRNTFCFALRVPKYLEDHIYKITRDDMDQFFCLKTGIQKRRVKCMILKRISTIDKIHTKGMPDNYEIANGKLLIENKSIRQLFLSLLDVIIAHNLSTPLLDETNYHHNIDIVLPWVEESIPLKNISIQRLNNSLFKYGLSLTEEYRNIDMLVIEDKRVCKMNCVR